MKELTIEKLSHDLRGIAQVAGVPWLVDGTLPDERVLVCERVRYSNRMEADLVDVMQPSALRIRPPCEYAAVCGGCDVQHMNYETQLVSKQHALKEQLARIENSAVIQWLPALAADPWAYRRRTRLACRWLADKKHLAMGFRQRHSQSIIEIAHCAVLEPALQKILPSLRQCLSRWSQPRQLGHVELLVADNGVGILLRVTSTISPVDETLLQSLAARHGVTVFVQQGEKDSVQYVSGNEKTLFLRHEKTGSTLTCVPGDFLQANGMVNGLLIDAVLTALALDDSDVVLEAFCGLGNFTLPLSGQVAQITALEVSEVMVQRAKTQAEMSGVSNVSWAVCDLSIRNNCEKIQAKASKVLLDPPREGAQVFCQYVPLEGVDRIVYVSCNPSTFARDAAILSRRGFVLDQVSMVDMFPQTSHIELLAVFYVKPDAASKKIKCDPVSGKKILKKLKR